MRWTRAGVWPAAAVALSIGCSGQRPGTAVPASSASAGAAPTAPVVVLPKLDVGLPKTAPPSFVERADCGLGQSCTMSHLVPDDMVRGLQARGPISVWEETIAGDAEVIFPADSAIELVGVVIDGGLSVIPQEKDLVERPMGQRWMGFRAPGAGISLAPLKGKRARLVLAIAVVGPETSLAKHVEAWDKDKAPFTWTERQKRIDIIDFETQPDLSWGNGAYHARIGWEASKYQFGASNGKGPKKWDVDDQPALAMDLLSFAKDAPIEEHAHDRERECLAILEGDGQLTLKGSNGSERAVNIEPGMTACIPAGMRHSWKPAGTTPFSAVQFYTPPGPEQRYKKLAGKTP